MPSCLDIFHNAAIWAVIYASSRNAVRLATSTRDVVGGSGRRPSNRFDQQGAGLSHVGPDGQRVTTPATGSIDRLRGILCGRSDDAVASGSGKEIFPVRSARHGTFDSCLELPIWIIDSVLVRGANRRVGLWVDPPLESKVK